MAKRGRKPKAEVEHLRQNIFQRPSFLDDVPLRGDKARAIHSLSKKLKLIKDTECVVYTVTEFSEKFKAKNIKATLSYVKTELKRRYGIKKVKTHQDETGRIYIW